MTDSADGVILESWYKEKAEMGQSLKAAFREVLCS